MKMGVQIESVTKPSTKRDKHMNLLYKTGFCLFWTITKCLYRMKVYGPAKRYPQGALLASNHASFFDPPFVGTAWKEEIHFLARDTLFNQPLLKQLLPHLNAHPIKRETIDPGAIKMMTRLIKNGEKVLIFPEGSRTYDGQLLPIKSGIGFIARLAHCAIIPVYLSGTHEVWGRQRKFPKPWGKVACVFGSPILWEEFAELDKRQIDQAIADRLTLALEQLRSWYENGAQGTPP